MEQDPPTPPDLPKRNRHVGHVAVEVVHKHLGEVTAQSEQTAHPEPLADVQHVAHPAYVSVKGSITRNTGNFNSVQVAVMYSMPCIPTLDQMDRTYEQLSLHVDQKLNLELDMALGITPQDTGVDAPLPPTTPVL